MCGKYGVGLHKSEESKAPKDPTSKDTCVNRRSGSFQNSKLLFETGEDSICQQCDWQKLSAAAKCQIFPYFGVLRVSRVRRFQGCDLLIGKISAFRE